FEGLGDPATTTVAWIEIDYRIQTPYLRVHTTVIEPRDEKGVAELLHHGCATLRLLRRKLLRDIADARRIFVARPAVGRRSEYRQPTPPTNDSAAGGAIL